MDSTWLFGIVFISVLGALAVALVIGFGVAKAMQRSSVRKKLAGEESFEELTVTPTVLLEDPNQEKTGLSQIKFFADLENKIEGAGLDWKVDSVLITSAVGLIAGCLVGWAFPFLLFPELTIAVLGFLGAIFPFLVIHFKREKRMRDMEQQLPEALDFISRAVRAGHAFSVSLELLSNEMPDPIKTEFRRVFQEVNLGSALDTAMRNLAHRIPIIDVRFFVSAVLLQRETGGNLSEILTKLAQTIRERFRLKGHIKAVTAHSRMTAVVVGAVPIVALFLLSFSFPGYAEPFVKEPEGRTLAVIAIISQALGFLILRKLVNFKW
jgi:tight adherence protein B